MIVTQSELDRFHDFASEQVSAGEAMTWDELIDRWRFASSSAEERAASVAAIREALDDFEAGDRGRPAEQILRELREEINGDAVQ